MELTIMNHARYKPKMLNYHHLADGDCSAVDLDLEHRDARPVLKMMMTTTRMTTNLELNASEERAVLEASPPPPLQLEGRSRQQLEVEEGCGRGSQRRPS